ncbi:hypothetical protein CALCODRAFT_371346 [Calocera cornea HHB12733]|uniref:Uncharacterized protein n=1 Tax=Calocera cornea HHB12733 TaxID=1353952 RepID=A0A165EHC6_9BASI|nr:hypothetical protein CALCODRAFT_371346 [Calocera cornea HHB12733]
MERPGGPLDAVFRWMAGRGSARQSSQQSASRQEPALAKHSRRSEMFSTAEGCAHGPDRTGLGGNQARQRCARTPNPGPTRQNASASAPCALCDRPAPSTQRLHSLCPPFDLPSPAALCPRPSTPASSILPPLHPDLLHNGRSTFRG